MKIFAAALWIVGAAVSVGAEGLARRERETLVLQAETLFRDGRPAEARALWERAIAGGAGPAENRRWRPWIGRAYEAEGNFQKALTAYQEAFDHDPRNVDRMVDLARVYGTVDLKERALELYARAHEKDRGRMDVVLALGDIHYGAGRFVEARRCAEEALRRDSRDPSARRLLARVEESEGDLVGAARRREGLLAEKPTGPEAFHVGRLWSRAGEPEMAERAYAQAAALGVSSAELFFERGVIAWRRDDLAGAERWLKEAEARAPKDPSAALLLSVVDWQRGRAPRALARLREMPWPPDSALRPLKDRLLTALVYGAPGERK